MMEKLSGELWEGRAVDGKLKGGVQMLEWTGMEWTTGMAKKIKFPGSTGLIGHVLSAQF